MSEIIICPKCDHTMAYDSYFKAVICRQCGHREEPVITNADRIRSMSDEELAHKITAWSEVNDYEEDDYDPCVLAWLKMPYTEESK